MTGYTVRYGSVPARSIYNFLEPKDVHVDQLNEQHQFYEKLEKSILERGIENPLNILCGGPKEWVSLPTIPEEMKTNPDKILMTYSIGGSRLWVAQKLNMDVPCLIADWTNQYEHFELVETEREALKYFKNPPMKIRFNETGVWIKNLPHTHLGDTDYNDRSKRSI